MSNAIESHLIEVPGTDWQRVSPKLMVVELVGSAIMLVLAASATITFVVLRFPGVAWPLGAVTGMIAVNAALVPRRIRSIGYQLRPDDLLFRRGVLYRRIVAVPYGRMQLIDINRGPLARLLGLSDLKFVTAAAATGVSIPGLGEEDAVDLRDRLVALAETRRAGL